MYLANWPRIFDINNASHEQLCYWFKNLPETRCQAEREAMILIAERINKLGGYKRFDARKPTGQAPAS